MISSVAQHHGHFRHTHRYSPLWGNMPGSRKRMLAALCDTLCHKADAPLNRVDSALLGWFIDAVILDGTVGVGFGVDRVSLPISRSHNFILVRSVGLVLTSYTA